MNYGVLIALLSVLLFSCGEEKPKLQDKNLLPATLVNNPRTADGNTDAAIASLATMDFKDSLYNFGTIQEGEVVVREFEFTNNGKSPLIISNAQGSCGCTAADFPKDPVAPGKAAKVKVEFHSEGKHGHQEKSVSLTTNSNRGNHVLYLKGEVKSKK